MTLEDAIRQGLVSEHETSIGKAYHAKIPCSLSYNYIKFMRENLDVNFLYNNAIYSEYYDTPRRVVEGNVVYEYYQYYGLANDIFGLKKLSIPKSIKKIQDFACIMSYYLTTTDGLRDASELCSIGRCAFAYCVRLGISQTAKSDNLQLPLSLQTISYGAFMGCPALKTVYIPKKVSTICANAFGSCSGLKYLVFIGKTEDEIRQMPNFGEWTTGSDKVKYVPGIVDGSVNPLIDNFPDDNTGIGFSVTAFSVAQQKVNVAALTPEFFKQYRSPMLGASGNDPYSCTSYSKDICGPDKDKPCYDYTKDDTDCLLHDNNPTCTTTKDDPLCQNHYNTPPCTAPDYPCDNPFMKDYGKPKPTPNDPPLMVPAPNPLEEVPDYVTGDIPGPNGGKFPGVELGGNPSIVIGGGPIHTDSTESETKGYGGFIGIKYPL